MLSFFRRIYKKINPDVPPREGIFLSLVYEDTLVQVGKNLPGLMAVSIPWSIILPFVLRFLTKGKVNPAAFFALSLLTTVMINVYFVHFQLPAGKRIVKTLTGSWKLFFMILFSYIIATAPIGVVLFGIKQLVGAVGKPAMPLLVLGILFGALFLMIIISLIVPVLANEAGSGIVPLKRILYLIRKQKFRILGCIIAPWLVLGFFISLLFKSPAGQPAPSATGMILFGILMPLLFTIFFNSLYAVIYQHLRAEAGEDYPEYITGPVPGEKKG